MTTTPSNTASTASNSATAASNTAASDRLSRRGTETRPAPRTAGARSALRTTELIAYLATVVAVIVTAAVVGDGDGGAGNGPDLFDARQAMEYITYLTIAYMIARGLAKSGSREHHTD